MRIGAFSVVDGFPPSTGEGRDRYQEVLQLSEGCDRAGLSSFWVAEHHFHDGGVCPNPAVLLAAASQRTQRIRLGVLVSVLPFHDPVDLAEQYGLLDRLTHGRLNLGLGSGYIPLEFEGFGIDPASKRDRFDRTLETMLAAFRGDLVRGAGPSSTEVRVNVRPQQAPAPPLWIAVQRREALPFVARRSVSVALIPYATLDSLEELKDEVTEFREALPAGSSATVSAAFHVYAGPNVPLARAALQRYLDARRATQSVHYLEKVQRDARHADVGHLERSGLAVLGSPPEAAKQIARIRETGIDELLGIFDFGGLPSSEVLASVRAVGDLL
ncbi:MAG: LLM class flavin-dependent oxidoreductase [Thermoplasmata archaeon]|nr:LLM class flavin-dependent oxidoreductase [Thermoplasmata archaeon]